MQIKFQVLKIVLLITFSRICVEKWLIALFLDAHIPNPTDFGEVPHRHKPNKKSIRKTRNSEIKSTNLETDKQWCEQLHKKNRRSAKSSSSLFLIKSNGDFQDAFILSLSTSACPCACFFLLPIKEPFVSLKERCRARKWPTHRHMCTTQLWRPLSGTGRILLFNQRELATAELWCRNSSLHKFEWFYGDCFGWNPTW